MGNVQLLGAILRSNKGRLTSVVTNCHANLPSSRQPEQRAKAPKQAGARHHPVHRWFVPRNRKESQGLVRWWQERVAVKFLKKGAWIIPKRLCSFKFYSLVHSYVYSRVYYSHIVTDFLIYFVILLKSHFSLSSLESVLQDGSEQSSSLAPSESPAESLKMPTSSPLSSDSDLIGLGGGGTGGTGHCTF